MLATPQLLTALANRLSTALGPLSPWRVLPCVHEPAEGEDYVSGFELVSEQELVPQNYTMRIRLRLIAYALAGDVNNAPLVRSAADALQRALHSVLATLPCGAVISALDASPGSTMVLSSSLGTLNTGAFKAYTLFSLPFFLDVQQ